MESNLSIEQSNVSDSASEGSELRSGADRRDDGDRRRRGAGILEKRARREFSDADRRRRDRRDFAGSFAGSWLGSLFPFLRRTKIDRETLT